MKFIGITGGVGAGKSEVLKFFREHYNCRVMLADEIAHDLMEPGTACYEQLKTLFTGVDVYETENGPFDRKKLAAVIFSDDSLLQRLNAIVHPAVHVYVTETAEAERKKGTLDLLVLEAALLIEENYGEICDELWYVYASEEVRRKRLKESRGYSDEKTSGIFAAQLSEEEYRKHCSVILDNGGTFSDTIRQIREILYRYGINEQDGSEPL
jgi:dephospho-CoA kinase